MEPPTENRRSAAVRLGDTVLFVAVPAPLGGSNRSLATLLEAIGRSVRKVLASPPEGDFLDLVRARGLVDEHLPLPYGTKWRRILASIRIARWVRAHRQELLAVHANATRGLNLSSLAALTTRIPIVVWVHDPVGTRWGRRLGPIVGRLLRNVTWAAVSEVARQVAVDNGLCRSDEVELIPNPLNTETVVGGRKRPSDRVVVGYLGAGRHRKGFDLLPQIARALSGQPVELRLFTARIESEFGNPVWDELDRIETIPVTNPGKNPDVRQVYAQCDLVLVPSRDESFSMVTVEAMANGIPVVASDLEPIRQLLLGGGLPPAGVVFPVGDPAAAGEAIASLIANPKRRMAMSDAGRTRAKELDARSVASRFLALYGVKASD
jgi:phosphatidylinositol alpha-mannosyltransferase